MTEQPHPHERAHDAATIDELISASLDDELDAAAADHALSSEAARVLVDGNPARAEAISAARDRMATPPPPLDDLTRRRLVSAAVTATAGEGAATRARRARGLPTYLAGAAAALLLLAGIAALFTHGSDSRHDDRASGASSRATESASTPLQDPPSVDLGEVSDPAVLRDRLQGVAGPGYAADAGAKSLPGDATVHPGSTAPDRPGRAVATTAATSASDSSTRVESQQVPGQSGGLAPSIDCATFLAADFDDIGPPVLLATATYKGAPAGVLVVAGESARLAVVYDAGACTILATQSLTTP